MWEELEELLIGADTGVSTTQKILGDVQLRVEKERAKDGDAVRRILQEELIDVLQAGREKGRIWGEEEPPPPDRPKSGPTHAAVPAPHVPSPARPRRTNIHEEETLRDDL